MLVLDDNPVSARVLHANLIKAGHQVVTAEDAPSALEALAEANADAIIADLGVAGGMGMQIVGQIRAEVEWSDIPILVTAAMADPVLVREAGARRVRRFLLKPVDVDVLLGEIDGALREDSRLALRAPEEAMRALSLDGEEYEALLQDLSRLLDEAESKLSAVANPESELEAWSDAVESVRKLADVVSSVATGPFLDWDADSGATPSMEDWRRVALRDLKKLRAQIAACTGEAEAADPAAEKGDGSSAAEPAGDGEMASSQGEEA